ncbi:MAG: Trp family transcriptional regulator [Patescibacteria group bacterium]
MVNISRRQLPEELLEKIYELFFQIFNKFETKQSFFTLMDDFFTPKEKILLAKRITIIYLLIKKIEQRNIADFLKVSTSTVCKYALLLENKDSEMVKIMEEIIKKEKIFDFIDNLLADFLIQPGLKIGHWDLYWQHRRKKERKQTYGM